MTELQGPVAVVCHDAGAANIIIAELQMLPGPWLPVMAGPAAAAWRASGLLPQGLLTLDQALPMARSVLTGTGWASNLEHAARREARHRGLPSVAVMDHWVNYAARFERDGERVLPDEIWVTDEDAFAMASRQFPGVRVDTRRNHYLHAQLAAISAAAGPEPGRVLYLLEPIRYTWMGLTQPGEFEALDFLAGHLHLLQETPGPTMHLRLRPHPSEPPDKYGEWLMAHPHIDVALDNRPTLAQAIAAAEWVAGCETAALAVALAAGRKTVATLPPQAPICRLPQRGLLHLRAFPGASWPATSPGPPIHSPT